MAAQDCVRRLETDAKAGLSRTQAERRLREAGRNELEGGKRRGPAARFFSQFTDFMVLVLLAAAGLSFAAAWLEGNGDWVDPVMILLIVVINAAAGAAQEGRAERAMEALRRMSSPKARVVRGGREQQIDAALLAPGDVVRLTAGDVVPADLRLIETNGLQAGESALTGESLPVEKDADAVLPADTPAGDRRNMIYSPAEVTAGSGLGVVTATGMQTEVGRIAGLIQSQEAPKTPLQKRLAQTGRWLGAAAHGGAARNHPASAGRGNAGQRLRDLFGQNGHTHGKPYDGARDCDGGGRGFAPREERAGAAAHGGAVHELHRRTRALPRRTDGDGAGRGLPGGESGA